MSKPVFPFARKMQAINIQRQFYTMASEDSQSAEITMYGEIVETQPVNWRTGKPVQGDFIIQKEFLQDLEAISGVKALTIRMNNLDYL